MAGEQYIKEAIANLRRGAADIRSQVSVLQSEDNQKAQDGEKRLQDMRRAKQQNDALMGSPNTDDALRANLLRENNSIQTSITELEQSMRTMHEEYTRRIQEVEKTAQDLERMASGLGG